MEINVYFTSITIALDWKSEILIFWLDILQILKNKHFMFALMVSALFALVDLT